MTLFDLTVGDMMNESILGRAQERDIIRIEAHQIRDYTLNKQKQVDDYPYGGGHGAVMQADPLYQCWKHIVDTFGPGHTIYMSPAGKTFVEADARRLRDDYDHLILVCGHYEGIDERFIEECVDEEISIGDNDTLSAMVAASIRADLLILLSDIDGLYDSDPHKNPDARLIPVVERLDDHIRALAGGSGSSLGTGGMVTKLQAAQIATEAGCEMVIANGHHPAALYDIAAGQPVGTRFLAGRKDL